VASILRFGPFELDRQNFELKREGHPVKLDRTPMELLLFLVERAGTLVSREEAVDHVWGKEVFVEAESSLYTAIRKVRRALSDDIGEPRFIQTVSRKGYRFIAEVEELEAPSAPAARTPASVSSPRRRVMVAAAGTVALVGLVIWFWIQIRAAPTFTSLAVLPLENLSGDPTQDFFADEITDELITELAKVSSLRVISRTSVMQYKRARKPLRSVARELGVGAIVEGSVVRAGNRVRVTAQLISAATDQHLWAQSYEQELGDILALQGQVARDIATRVNAKLTVDQERNLTQVRPIGLEAHDNCLKGHLVLHDNPADAVSYFERAIELNPRYAQAYAGLAEAYFWPAWDWGTVVPAEAFPKGKAAALKALELDSSSAEGHAALGWEQLFYEWNWRSAEAEFREAIRLSPNNPWAHHHYARLLAVTGRFDESLQEGRRMMELDPLNFMAVGNLVWMSYLARRYDESIRESQRMIETHPSILGFFGFLAWNYEAQGRFQDAIEALQRSGEHVSTTVDLGFTYGRMGNQHAARAALMKLQTISKQRYVPPYFIALVYAGLRDNDRAFDGMEKAFEERSPFLAYLKTDPKLDVLRSDVRFTSLVHRVGFP
jgi:TolB-like protein/DNA-binding winged helix-turn-helix (wHTH) protein/Flp pilus assembly protein TadD